MPEKEANPPTDKGMMNDSSFSLIRFKQATTSASITERRDKQSVVKSYKEHYTAIK